MARKAHAHTMVGSWLWSDPAFSPFGLGQRGGGSMPLLRMRGAASGDDMNLTSACAASDRFDTASTPTAKST